MERRLECNKMIFSTILHACFFPCNANGNSFCYRCKRLIFERDLCRSAMGLHPTSHRKKRGEDMARQRIFGTTERYDKLQDTCV